MDFDNRQLLALGMGMTISLLAFILYHVVEEQVNSELRFYRLREDILAGFKALEPQPDLTNDPQQA